MRRRLRPAVTLALTLACAAYLVWKIDLGQTLHVLGEVRLAYFATALALLFATIPPLAWRWRLLLRARRGRQADRIAPTSWSVSA